jgi:hypothetical protein
MHLWGKVAALHIGAHKTATSVLQRYLRNNEPEHRRLGVLYLRRSELSRHIGWGERLIADPAPLTARMTRFRFDPRFRVLIGSYENLMGRPFPEGGDGRLYPNATRNIKALDRALPGTACKVVLSVRPQPDFLESYYLQTVHEGGHENFADWLKRVDLGALSWRPIVDALHATFGRDRVEVVDFRLIEDGQAAFLRHLLTRIDPRLDLPIDPSGMYNRSISARGLAMALAANPHLRTGAERSALRRFLQEHFSNVDFPRPVLFSPEEKAELWARYRADYEDLVARR